MDFNKIIDENIRRFESQLDDYPTLAKVATPMARPSSEIIGRDMHELRAILRTPEKANVILLGDPGVGKTAFVQQFTYDEESTNYLVLNIDIERLVGPNSTNKDTEMTNGLLDMVNEVSDYVYNNDIIIVLFIDEFHRIAMASESAVEALKPILEKSTRNGFRIVAATTFDEYDQWISSNRALDQRLMRMTIPELPKTAVIRILESLAKVNNVYELAEPNIFEDIYETSRQILISNAQPRASIDILLNVIGNMTKTEYMRNGELVREYSTVEELNIDAEYPLSRALLNKVIQRSYGIDIDNNVDIADVRDALHKGIYNQEQAVESVLSLLEMAFVGFTDPTRAKASWLSTGSTGTGKALDDDTPIYIVRDDCELLVRHGDIRVGDKVYGRNGKLTNVTGVYPQGLKQVYEVTFDDGRTVRAADEHLWLVYNHETKSESVMNTEDLLVDVDKYSIPVNQPVEFVEKRLDDEPYNIGSIVAHACKQEIDVFIKDDLKKILKSYLYGSVDQRKNFLKGLYQTKSLMNGLAIKCNVKELSELIQDLIWSLGYKCIIKQNEYSQEIHLLGINDQYLSILKIRKLDEYVPMTCIMVEDDEHLYQLANGIVTHNTEMAKIISSALQIPLKRFDMSRYSRPEDAVKFADDLAQAAWSAPNGYILVDEVEKSSAEAMNILLQVLDDARLTAANNPNRVISFTGNLINLTTNLGSAVYQHNDRFGDNTGYIDTDLIYQDLKESKVFNSAVLGRIDAIVPFQTLPTDVKSRIANKELERNLDIVRTHNRTIFISKDIIPYVVIDRTTNDSENGGARDVKRNLKNVVLREIASYVANNKNELPIIVRLDGVPRHKDTSNNDAMTTNVEIVPCHNNEKINNVLAQVSQKVGKTLHNCGLFVDETIPLEQFVNEIVGLIRQGYTKFKTSEYDEPITNQTKQFIVGVD